MDWASSIWTDRSFWADFVGLIGFPLTIAGLIGAIVQGQRAEKAAKDAQNLIRKFDLISDVSQVISSLEELITLHRARKWELAINRYTLIKSTLSSMEVYGDPVVDKYKQLLERDRLNIGLIIGKVEGHLSLGRNEPDIPSVNKMILTALENLNKVLVELRRVQ